MMPTRDYPLTGRGSRCSPTAVLEQSTLKRPFPIMRGVVTRPLDLAGWSTTQTVRLVNVGETARTSHKGLRTGSSGDHSACSFESSIIDGDTKIGYLDRLAACHRTDLAIEAIVALIVEDYLGCYEQTEIETASGSAIEVDGTFWITRQNSNHCDPETLELYRLDLSRSTKL